MVTIFQKLVYDGSIFHLYDGSIFPLIWSLIHSARIYKRLLGNGQYSILEKKLTPYASISHELLPYGYTVVIC
jgi:hypothetical protein